MKFNFNSIWKYIAGGGTVLGYQAFYERITSKQKAEEVNRNIQDMNQKIDSLYDNMEKTNKDKNEIIDMQNSFKEVKNSLNELSNINKKYWDKPSENVDENFSKLFESYKEEFGWAFERAQEITDKVNKKYSQFESSINKLADDNYVIKLINEFNNYLSNLTITEICLVINISSSIFVLTCLVTILFSVYGNKLIDKLNLEQKYPKLASFIKLRVKLQHTYVFINTLLIIIALILMIIINFITLVNGD
uniref:Uncharacterized protein n=2 Tax=Epichloe TaxID=5112 RepID=A0A1J0D0C1_EPINE|nr:hypothetical protein [Epichloe festucae]APB96802.1 hypothetical protein [Epichloe festucae]APB96862.1 hypothetical protein [Epichloe hybrida]